MKLRRRRVRKDYKFSRMPVVIRTETRDSSYFIVPSSTFRNRIEFSALSFFLLFLLFSSLFLSLVREFSSSLFNIAPKVLSMFDRQRIFRWQLLLHNFLPLLSLCCARPLKMPETFESVKTTASFSGYYQRSVAENMFFSQ